MQHLEFVRLPLSFSCLIRPNIDASGSQHKIGFETAFKTGQMNNWDGMSVLCFPIGKTNKIVALWPRFRFPRSHDCSNLLTNR